MGGDSGGGATSKAGVQLEKEKFEFGKQDALLGREIAGEGLKQSKQRSAATMPVLEQMSAMIQSALKGDIDKFASSPIAQRKSSMTQQAGDRRKAGAQRQLATKGLDKSGAGMAYVNDIDAQTSGAVLDSVLSEMTRYLDIAPGFAGMAGGGGMGGGGGGGGGWASASLAPYAQMEHQSAMQSRQNKMQLGAGLGAGAGAIGGALLGTMVFPGIGSAVGAAAGAALGGGLGGVGGSIF